MQEKEFGRREMLDTAKRDIARVLWQIKCWRSVALSSLNYNTRYKSFKTRIEPQPEARQCIKHLYGSHEQDEIKASRKKLRRKKELRGHKKEKGKLKG